VCSMGFYGRNPRGSILARGWWWVFWGYRAGADGIPAGLHRKKPTDDAYPSFVAVRMYIPHLCRNTRMGNRLGMTTRG
jgi:hypothetical protein